MSRLSNAFTEALGLTLLDSLWQGAIILLICTLALTLMRSKAARWRYRLVLLGILALPIAGLFTFFSHYEPEVVAQSILPTETSFGITEFVLPQEPIAPVEASNFRTRWQNWAAANAQWVVTLWAIGLLLFGLRLSGGFYMVSGLRRSARPIADGDWVDKLKVLCASLNITIPVQIKESVKVSSPIVVGYLKPIIIFPMGLIQGISTEEVEAILLHELAHIKRHDYLINLFVSLLQAIYFYHPAFWWLQRQLDAEREYSCDDMVLTQMNRLALVKALTAVKEFQMSQYSPALGFASQKNQLLKRVERIMKKKTKTNWLGGLISMSVLLLSFFLMSYRSTSSLDETTLSDLPLEEVAMEMDIQNIDSLSIEQAVMQLLNQEDNKLILELDGQGRLVDIMRNGEPIGQIELKIFQQAHAKLRDYKYSESTLKRQQEAYLKDYLQRFEELQQAYKNRSDALNEQQRALNEQQQMQELKKKAEEYEQLIREYSERLKEGGKKKRQVSHDVEELVKYSPKVMRDVKKGWYDKWKAGDSINFTLYPNGAAPGEYKRFKVTLTQLKDHLAYMEEHELPLGEELSTRESSFEKYAKELRAMEREMAKKQPLEPAKFEFANTERSQGLAMKHLAGQSNSLDELLLVVDGKVKEEWRIADLDQLDPSLVIKSVEVIRAKSITEQRYKKWKNSKDALLLIETEPGKPDFKRPSFGEVLGADLNRMALEQEEIELARRAKTLDSLKWVEEVKAREWTHHVDTDVGLEMERIKAEKLMSEERVRTLDHLWEVRHAILRKIDSIKASGYVSPVSMEFTGSDLAQRKALEVASKAAGSLEKALVVVDGVVKEDWTVSDLNKIDRSLKFQSIDVIRASKVTEAIFQKYMSGRDYLFKVATKPGKKNYRRPDVYVGRLVTAEQAQAEKKEYFTSTMLDQLNAEGLTPRGWEMVVLTQKSMYISGLKQPKKTHKKYLKLYQQIMGKKLPKDERIRIKE